MMKPAYVQERFRLTPRTRAVACAVLLVVLPLAAYLPAYHGGFYSDDVSHIIQNERLRTARGLGEIWSDLRGTDDLYYPLTFTTYWIDYHLWGMNPAGYHTANIILHALNSLLVWLVFRRLGIPGAWFAGAIFALHPVHVESVAWVTERRNTLSAFFYLLSILAYLGYRRIGANRSDAAGGGAGAAAPVTADGRRFQNSRRGAYFAAFVCFAAALLSKTATLSLPAAILLVIWWKKGRLSPKDWLPLVPFFVIAIALSLWTAGLERTLIERGGPGWGDYTIADRLIIAGRAVWFYLGKLLYPVGLSFVYPQWAVGSQGWPPNLYPLGVIALAGLLVAAGRRIGRGPAAAWLFFVGTLLPVLGLVDFFYMMLSYVADRFLYLPSLGIIALVTGYAAAGYSRLGVPARRVAAVITVAVLTALAALTWQRSSCFENAEKLYGDVLAKHSDSWAGHYSLGVVLAAGERPADALPHLEAAEGLKPNFPSIRGYLGVVYAQLGRYEDALRSFREALDQNPNDAEIRTNLGVALVNIGRYDAAIEEYGKALTVSPGYGPALRNLSRVVLYRIDEIAAGGDPGAALEFARQSRALALSVGARGLAADIDLRIRGLAAPPE
jgi:tetratricopeptide (TPR) repeat protein